MQGGMEGRQTVWLSLCICNERECGGRRLQAVTRLIFYVSACLPDPNEGFKIWDLLFLSFSPLLSKLRCMCLLLLKWICHHAFCLFICVGVCVHSPADVDTHLLSWRANWLLMFLCKHHSTPGGRGINVHSVLTLNTAASSYTGLTFIHIYAHVLCRSFFPLLRFSLFIPLQHTNISSLTNTLSFSCSISHSQASQSFLWFPCCTLACSRSIYNHRFWGLYLLPLRCYKHGYQSPATCITVPLCLLLAGFYGTTTPWRWSSMTTWTSSAPITLKVRYRCWMPSDTCSTWWSAKTTNPASPSHTTRCVGSVAIHLLLTPRRSSRKSFSALLRLLWEKSSAKEKATIISVSVTVAVFQICVCWLDLFYNILISLISNIC